VSTINNRKLFIIVVEAKSSEIDALIDLISGGAQLSWLIDGDLSLYSSMMEGRKHLLGDLFVKAQSYSKAFHLYDLITSKKDPSQHHHIADCQKLYNDICKCLFLVSLFCMLALIIHKQKLL
jgi:hypothetical protein